MNSEAEARIIGLLEQLLAASQHVPVPAPPALMTDREVAREFAVDVRTLRRLRHEGVVPEPIYLGGSLRWKRAEVERFLRARKA